MGREREYFAANHTRVTSDTTSANSVEWWLRRATRRGYRLNNLFQLNDGVFQANFRKPNSKDKKKFTTFGFGKTPQEALMNALQNKGESSRPEIPKRIRPRLPKEFVL